MRHRLRHCKRGINLSQSLHWLIKSSYWSWLVVALFNQKEKQGQTEAYWSCRQQKDTSTPRNKRNHYTQPGRTFPEQMLSGIILKYFNDLERGLGSDDRAKAGRLVVNGVREKLMDEGRKPDLGSPALLLLYLRAKPLNMCVLSTVDNREAITAHIFQDRNLRCDWNTLRGKKETCHMAWGERGMNPPPSQILQRVHVHCCGHL